ncbi:cation channel family protein [Stylonychia lemnae]|uniref:Cation channel family protein n=1 Tax=Stylonychia lemnae TaxID=5949 RepID=A0A078ANI7_STYLE|nr:cation channel family protein [Stylonychia lemnae]|eukprot:CDW83739.1 cation channel family protein [Stylonychia lemnae]
MKKQQQQLQNINMPSSSKAANRERHNNQRQGMNSRMEKQSRYDDQEMDDMMKSSSSFGLPSESYAERISDKEIQSDRNLNSPSRNQNTLNATKKPFIADNGLDISFEFLDDQKKGTAQQKKGGDRKKEENQFGSPSFTTYGQNTQGEPTNRLNEKEVTRSTQQQVNIGISNMKHQSKNLLNKQQQSSQEKANKNKIIQQNIFGNQTMYDKGIGALKKDTDKTKVSKTQNLMLSPKLQNQSKKHTATNQFEGGEYPTFQNLNKQNSNQNDDSYISSHSGINLLAGGLDNSIHLNNPSELNMQAVHNGQRIINNNYQNIVNLRASQQQQSHLPGIQNGYLQKVINNIQDKQQEKKATPLLNLEGISQMNGYNAKYQTTKTSQANQNKVMPISKFDSEEEGGAGLGPTSSQEFTMMYGRNFSAGQRHRNSPSKTNINMYQGTISDIQFHKTEILGTRRESNDYFDFNDENDANSRLRNYAIKNPNDFDNVSYDESERSKVMRMPNLDASKIQLQEEIGYLLSKHTEENAKNEDDNEKDKEAEKQPFYRIVDKDPLDIINDYQDRWPCLKFRKSLAKIRIIINRIALVVISNKYFESVSIMVIITNSLFLALDDPLTTQQPAYLDYSDSIFQYLYTFEMVMKILGYGFIFNKGAYLRDAWNVLDFVIVVSGYISLILSGGGVNLSVLRSFRVIRPLRTISSIQGLRVIVQALVSSLPLLRDTILVLLFFFLIFAIAGVQLFSGALMQRCFAIETGIIMIEDKLCGGGSECPSGFACGKTMKNPNYGATNFDNIFYAFLQIFQTVTLEGWTTTMLALEQTVGQWTIIYFVPIVFIGAFFLLNLTLAVIKSKFTEEHNKNKNKHSDNASKKKPKIYGNESEEDDQDVLQDNRNSNEAPKLTKVQQKLKEIEESLDLTPRSKKLMKEKAKLQELMKRVDFAIKAKEVKDKVTPRGSQIFNFSQMSMDQIGLQAVALQSSKFKNHHVNKINVAEIFNSRFFHFQVNSQNSLLKIDENDLSLNRSIEAALRNNNGSYANRFGARLNKKKFEEQFPIKEDDQENSFLKSSHKFSQDLASLIDNEDDKKYSKSDEKASKGQEISNMNRTQTMGKTKFSPWLGQVFEIQKQPQQEDHPNSARLLMGGFAGIKSKQFSEKEESDEILKLKREIYEKIAKNFNIFEFFDRDHPGDDEYSGDEVHEEIDLDEEEFDSFPQSRENNRRIQEDELVEILDQSNGSPNEPKYQRKSTMATVETKSFMKKRSFNWKDKTDQNLSDSGGHNGIGRQPQNEREFSQNITGTIGLNDQTMFTTHNMLMTSIHGNNQQTYRQQTAIARLQTHSPEKNSFKLDHQQFEDEDEKAKREEQEKKYNNTFKQKFKTFFRGCSMQKRQKRLKIIEEEFKKKMGRSKSQKLPKETAKGRSMQVKPSPIPTMETRGNINNSGNVHNESTLPRYQSLLKPSIRAKSEERKTLQLQKQHYQFKQKLEIMQKRRSKFFAQALKDIGKTQEQVLRELKENARSRRFIKLGGGFETTKKAEKKLLMRSGSLDFDKKPTLSLQDNAFKINLNLVTADDRLLGFSPKKDQSYKYDDDIRINKNQNLKTKISNISKKLKDQQSDGEVLDMDEVLKEKKKKLIIKMKNYKFTSVDDVFETRDDKDKDMIHSNVNANQKASMMKEPEVKKILRQGEQQHKPFQKKIMNVQKRFFEDLMQNEVIESDDNQETVLRRLEDEYNVDHRSNIHVTGTLSIVINKPTNENKMLNKNYYDQLNPSRRVIATSFIEEPSVNQLFILSKENIFSDNESLVHQNSARSQNLNVNLNQSQELLPVQKLGNNLKLNLRRINTRLSGGSKKSMKNGMSKKKTIKQSSVLGTERKSAPNSQRNNQNNQNTANQQTLTSQQKKQQQEALDNARYFMPRPEALTDKQILKRLNNEVKRSKVFSSVHFRKLPDSIRRKDGVVTVLPNKKKKGAKKGTITHRDEDGDDELSETSEEEERLNDDYFIDRELDYYEQILKAKNAAASRPIDNIEWSGQDIMQRFDPYKARIALESLNKIRVWPKGISGYVKRARVLLKHFMKSSFIENFMTLCVFANTIVLSIDHYGIKQDLTDILSVCNTLFTIIFAVEMFLKILAVGIVKYLRDKLNYMDGAIVILSLVELVFMGGKGSLKALRSIRIIRTFRVLRVARLLRGLKSMMNIIAVIQRSISSFIYLAMLLFLFIFIYALLENWNSVMFFAFGSTINPFISAIYFISCIFIGNFMLLNLFLAILLDSFTAVEEEDHDTPEKRVAREKQRIEDLKTKEGEDFINGLDEIEIDNAQKNVSKKKKKKKKKSSGKSRTGEEPLSNILEESIEIDLETLNSRKAETLSQKNILFKGIECQRSLYIFSQSNPLRIKIYEMVTNTKFETFILLVIVFSSIKLIYDTYTQDFSDDNPLVDISAKFDYVFTTIFTMELMLKCAAFGFAMDTNSYLRESWNQLDCFIVITSLIDALFSNVNLPIIKILRLLRILRPLRFISHNSSMKTVVVALLSSMGAIFNVGIVVIAVFLMFAILGVNLFAGKLQSCSVNPYQVRNELDCFKARGEWITYSQNFDNVPRAMITLFVVATQEGWPDLMYAYTDITNEAQGPKPGESPANAYFFVAFVFVGSFFFMNLFVGVLFMNFEAAQRDEKEALLLDGDEMKWVDMMKMIIQTKPEIIKTPKNVISQFLYKHTKPETKFDLFIMICIILNMLQMAINFEGQTVTYGKGLEVANYIFTGIFALEVMLKIVANGTAYFAPTWHKFDVFVVISSFLDIVMGQLSTATLKPLRVAPQLARVLRVLRVSRLFKLLNKYKGLQALIQTITFSIPSLSNVFALLLLVYFIFAVLGVFMFRQITVGNIIDPTFMNFANFSQALIILLRISTGEDWPTIMYDTMNTDSTCIQGKNCGYSYSPVFFIAFVMICSYVMLNLFVLIILQQFELYYLPQDNILQQFREDLIKFKFTWSKFSKEFEGLKIRSLDLVAYFKELEGNLGMKDDTDKNIMRYIVKMNLESDEEGFIYFNELLFKAMKRIYGKERTKKRILVDFELKTLDKLQRIKAKQQMKSRKNERVKAVTVNPFLSVMYKNMSFKAWAKIFKYNRIRRNDEVEYNLDRDSSDEELQQKDEDEYAYVTEKDESCYSDEGEIGGQQNLQQNEIIAEESSQHISDIDSPTKVLKQTSRHSHKASQDLQLMQEDMILIENNDQTIVSDKR